MRRQTYSLNQFAAYFSYTRFSPALRLYDLLEKYCPTPEQARKMWLGVFEFHNDNAKIESYLTEQEIMLSRIPRQGDGKK